MTEGLNRRNFIKLAGLGTALAFQGLWLSSCGGGGSSPSDPKNPLHIPSDSGGLLGYYRPSGKFTLTARGSVFEILPGKQTPMLTYQTGSYINPTIILRKGSNLEIDFKNETGESSIIHWHGFRADWKKDGHPYYAVANGQSYDYGSIPVIDRSGTYFYHPHPHGRTGYQVYKGLAGMIIIEDTDEDNLKQALDLRYGATDIPLIIQDKTFGADGSLIYNPRGMNGSMGFWGETNLVNLTPNPYMDVERRIYRFRILNGANARPYRLKLFRGNQEMRFWVIGVEGGLLDRPYEVREILVAPGERIDVLVDFRDANVGDVLRFFNTRHNLAGSGGGRMNNNINNEFEVLEFRVVKDSSYDKKLPSGLSTVTPIDTSGATTRDITLGMSNGKFTINDETWEDGYNDPNNPKTLFDQNNGDVVVIKYINSTGMYHPMHIHGFQFQVLSRSSGSLRATDRGWKDTVIVGPRETVETAVKMSHSFGSKQIYLLHCHILEHHDAGMMVQYSVGA